MRKRKKVFRCSQMSSAGFRCQERADRRGGQCKRHRHPHPVRLAERKTNTPALVIGTVSRAHRNGVRGTYDPNTKCTHRCKGATGNQCICECAGANHGVRAETPSVTCV